jgi:hypothetical protein
MAMIYTPLSELPHPPTFMLEEVEREERAYNTELMARILTINNARPIRLELRKKLNTHPVAKLLHDASARAKELIDRTNASLRRQPHRFPMATPIDFTPIEYWIEQTLKRKLPVLSFIKTLPKDEQEKLKNKTGKNKGQYNRRRLNLAQQVICKWRRNIRDYENDNWRKYEKCGFLMFYTYNMEYNNWAKGKEEDWYIQLPAVYYNLD